MFYEQDIYEPQDCENGEGVDDDGVVRWEGGRARYLYSLEEGSRNPGVAPNLDKPEGTLWRIDTVPPAVPMKTGEVTFGVVPEGHEQEVPAATTAPATLAPGRYLIFALADVGVPMTRCVFTR